jgi:hypothetical protein
VTKYFGDQDILQDVSGGESKKAAEDKGGAKNESEAGGGSKTPVAGVKSTEPYSVVTASSCEIIYLSREAFCEILSGGPVDEDDMGNFLKAQ